MAKCECCPHGREYYGNRKVCWLLSDDEIFFIDDRVVPDYLCPLEDEDEDSPLCEPYERSEDGQR